MLGLWDRYGDVYVTSGGAVGLDDIAHFWALGMQWSTEEVPARWEGPCRPECVHGRRMTRRRRDGSSYSYCPAQGGYRNQEMVDRGHDLCIGWFATPNSRGTKDCLDRAAQAGIPTYRVLPGLDVDSNSRYWLTRVESVS